MSVKQPLVCALVILFTSVDKLYIWAALLVLALFDEYNFISHIIEEFTMTVKCRTAIKALSLYLNLCLGVKF
jgi:hypothetical protein